MANIWISKYALTGGIKQCEWDGKISDYGYVFPKGIRLLAKIGKDAHFTEQEAKTAAEDSRFRKIESLKKAIVKLEAMRF